MTASDPDPQPSDEERSPEELGPRLQSELDALLAGLDEDTVEASPEAADGEPASALPKEGAPSDGADDLGPHLQAERHELLGEEPSAPAADELPEVNPSSLADLAEEPTEADPGAALEDDADLAALEAIEALDVPEIAAEAGVEAELDAFLAEDELESSESGDADGDFYDDGVIDAVSLDDYDAQRERGELQDVGFQDEHLGLAWDEETDFAEGEGSVSELRSQLEAGEAMLGQGPAAEAEAVFDDGDALADLVDELESSAGDIEAPAEALAPEPIAEEPAAAPQSSLEEEIFAEAPIEAELDGNDLFQETASQGAGEELFEDAPERSLEDALAAEEFDVDEDLFDFASLESGGGLAADDALDIEEFLEAVGKGESFGSVDSDAVEALAEGDDLFAQAGVDSASAEQESPALASIDAELEASEGQVQAAGQPARAAQPVVAQGQVVLAGGGRTWAWWLAGVAILVGTNLAVATFLQADRDIARHNLEEARASLVEATAELNDLRTEDAAFLTDLRTPLALPEPDPTSAFTQVHEALELEDFALARRRLYALLATVDRREPAEERETIEAHAAFMLADVDRLEADAMGERP